jgi:hypothetical protein
MNCRDQGRHCPQKFSQLICFCDRDKDKWVNRFQPKRRSRDFAGGGSMFSCNEDVGITITAM